MTELSRQKIALQLENELSISLSQVIGVLRLLDEGATVPFIARYRKEKTGGLSDEQLRKLSTRLVYLTELEERRQVILKSIDKQGKLEPFIKEQIEKANNKVDLEDLYLPYKQKRKTQASIAIKAGLEPLAHALLKNPKLEPNELATSYINADKGITDVSAAIDGAKQILMESFSQNAKLLKEIRNLFSNEAKIFSSLRKGKEKDKQAEKFRDYFAFSEVIHKIPSHRVLALFRGKRFDFLSLKIDVEHESSTLHPCEKLIAQCFSLPIKKMPASDFLEKVVKGAWQIRLKNKIERYFLQQLKQRADEVAIDVFAGNFKDLLLAPPAGLKRTMGLDPGIRTGVKVAVIDEVSNVIDHATVYPHAPKNQWQQSKERLLVLCKKHGVELVAIGNGTASRETEKLVKECCNALDGNQIKHAVISEAGASVYSASELASEELANLDVSIRGAVSIARRLQDPLAELVKIEPKAIGVGQYQHDVKQITLIEALNHVVEDCVNAVGVDVNSASAALLSRVAGLNPNIADNIVRFRQSNGKFVNREELKSVPRLGPRTFLQAAGFLRISDGKKPLDASAVHPEAYSLVDDIVAKSKKALPELLFNRSFLQSLNPAEFVNDDFGLATVKDVISELEKPGRDPRPDFKVVQFKKGIEKIDDLKEGMLLEGLVSNVTAFGAFVNVGVHQDGLVHISQLANGFVKNPRDKVKPGDIVKVKVLSIDSKNKRVSLTMRLNDHSTMNSATAKSQRNKGTTTKKFNKQKNRSNKQSSKKNMDNNSMAQAFARAGALRKK